LFRVAIQKSMNRNRRQQGTIPVPELCVCRRWAAERPKSELGGRTSRTSKGRTIDSQNASR
jgi:hypothetical protein